MLEVVWPSELRSNRSLTKRFSLSIRYDGRLLKLKINSLSRCWFCIRCYFSISIFFRLGKINVTKGKSFLRADLFVTPVLAPFLGPNRLFSFYSVLGIELFKAFKKKENKKNQKQKKSKVWAIPIPISTTEDEICWSNGYIYHFFNYIIVLLFVNVNVIYHE